MVADSHNPVILNFEPTSNRYAANGEWTPYDLSLHGDSASCFHYHFVNGSYSGSGMNLPVAQFVEAFMTSPQLDAWTQTSGLMKMCMFTRAIIYKGSYNLEHKHSGTRA